MKYHFRNGVIKDKKPFKPFVGVVSFLMIAAGIYVLYAAMGPWLTNSPIVSGVEPEATKQKLLSDDPGSLGDRLFIPQINVDVAIVTGDSEKVLEQGAWHRKPDNGNPTKGGNFVLSAHRFLLGTTPQQTRAKSPFYNINKLQEGDELFVDYQGKRYAYKIDRKYSVDRTAVEIEEPSEDAKLTLYSCDLRGEKAGREVVEAKPIGIVANGKIELNPQAN